MQIILTNGAQHHFASVDPDAQLHVDAFVAPQLLGAFAVFFLHEQGGVQGALGMIFMGDGRAKQGKDAVPERLCDVAFIAMYSIHHQFEGGIENGASLFGIKIRDKIS